MKPYVMFAYITYMSKSFNVYFFLTYVVYLKYYLIIIIYKQNVLVTKGTSN